MTFNRNSATSAEDGPAPEPASAWRRALSRMTTIKSWVWALPCVAIAGLYAIVWPAAKVTNATTTLSFIFLRWGHSASWILLSISFILRGTAFRWSSRSANLCAVAALVAYAAFICRDLLRD